jgi:hypothetical protein
VLAGLGVEPIGAGSRKVVLAGLKRPEREDDRRSCWSSLWWSGAGPLDSAGASHGLTDHLPARRGILDRVRLEPVGAHRDLRHHGRAMSAFRPGAWAPHPHVRSPSHTAVREHSMAERCASRAKRRPRKPVPRPAGWHLGGVGLAQADQVGGDGALRSGLPTRGCRSNERATGSGPACPYFRKLSSKALLYRCAVSSARDVTGR